MIFLSPYPSLRSLLLKDFAACHGPIRLTIHFLLSFDLIFKTKDKRLRIDASWNQPCSFGSILHRFELLFIFSPGELLLQNRQATDRRQYSTKTENMFSLWAETKSNIVKEKFIKLMRDPPPKNLKTLMTQIFKSAVAIHGWTLRRIQ